MLRASAAFSRPFPSILAASRRFQSSSAKMAWFDALVGPTLLPGPGKAPVPTSTVLSGKKFVAFYFSAHVRAGRAAPRTARSMRARVHCPFLRARTCLP